MAKVLKIIVASTNPVKIKAVEQGFKLMFPHQSFHVEGVSVDSKVGHQPMTDGQTYNGALNRVNIVSKLKPEADYWVGIEGGVEEKGKEMECFAWAIIKSKDKKYGKGRAGTIILPEKVARLVRSGLEMGEADDRVFKMTNSKQTIGAVGILTGGVIDRTKYYVDMIIFALIPFKNKNLY